MTGRTFEVLAAAALLMTGLATATSCTGGSRPVEQVTRTVDGETVIATYTMDATVTCLDTVNRRVTLCGARGKQVTFKARPEQNISGLQVGDRIQATLTEELSVMLRKAGMAGPTVTDTTLAAEAAAGGDAAAFAGERVELVSRISAINSARRGVTLQLPDGSSRTVTIHPDINLADARVGDSVVVQMTDAAAMRFQEK